MLGANLGLLLYREVSVMIIKYVYFGCYIDSLFLLLCWLGQFWLLHWSGDTFIVAAALFGRILYFDCCTDREILLLWLLHCLGASFILTAALIRRYFYCGCCTVWGNPLFWLLHWSGDTFIVAAALFGGILYFDCYADWERRTLYFGCCTDQEILLLWLLHCLGESFIFTAILIGRTFILAVAQMRNISLAAALIGIILYFCYYTFFAAAHNAESFVLATALIVSEKLLFHCITDSNSPLVWLLDLLRKIFYFGCITDENLQFVFWTDGRALFWLM